MDTAPQTPPLESLPILNTSMRSFTIGEKRRLKRFVIFSLSDKYLVAHHSYRFLWMAERKARSLRKWAITAGTVIIDQEDYANKIYSDDVMRFKDFQDFMDEIAVVED